MHSVHLRYETWGPTCKSRLSASTNLHQGPAYKEVTTLVEVKPKVAWTSCWQSNAIWSQKFAKCLKKPDVWQVQGHNSPAEPNVRGTDPITAAALASSKSQPTKIAAAPRVATTAVVTTILLTKRYSQVFLLQINNSLESQSIKVLLMPGSETAS